MATYVFGDIQGCFQSLQALLKKIQFSADRDQVWFCGDIINRGTQSLETLRYIHDLGDNAITVLGNHDLHCLAVAYAVRSMQKGDTLSEILAAPDRDTLLNWLRHRPIFHFDANFQAVLSHAGIPPGWSLAQCQQYARELEHALQQDDFINLLANMFSNEPSLWSETLTGYDRLIYITNAFTRMRFVSPDGHLSMKEKRAPEMVMEDTQLTPWFLHPGLQIHDQTILFGHWASLAGKQYVDHIIALDTGCVWGEKLSAYCLETKTHHMVDA